MSWPANDCSQIDSGDTAWMMTSAGLVLLMTPGLAFFYGGLVHRNSVITIIMQCFISMGLTSCVWVLLGFSLAFGEDGGSFLGNPKSYVMLTNMDGCTPIGYPMASTTGKIPGIMFAGYQMMFAIISPALITGAFADRVRFKAYLLFIFWWVLIVYCPFVHWIWHPEGFLAKWGIRDFAGGIVVHISAGFAALASIFVVGSRKYDSEEERAKMQVPHNRTFVALGTGLLWFGWFGFNGGSALSASTGQASFAIVNSSIAASMAMCVWMAIEWVHLGKPTLIGACIGAVAGLATVTPAAGWIRPWAAIVMGACASVWCFGCVLLRDKLKWDDALDVWGVHGMGGLLGSIFLGFLADYDISQNFVSRSGEFFGKQIVACIFTAVYSFVVSYLLLLVINFIIPVVPDRHEIAMGLDISLHGEYAYDDEKEKEKQPDMSMANPEVWDALPKGQRSMDGNLMNSEHKPAHSPREADSAPTAYGNVPSSVMLPYSEVQMPPPTLAQQFVQPASQPVVYQAVAPSATVYPQSFPPFSIVQGSPPTTQVIYPQPMPPQPVPGQYVYRTGPM